VILDDPPRPADTGVDATLDDLFRAAAARRPDAVALLDPPNRASFTDGAARTLTYAQADRMISAIAARLREMNLNADGVVALQIANTVEGVLAFLAVLRAELIAMPLPLLWRRADAIGAIRRSGASALIVSGRIGATDHFDLAINAAAEAFTVRHVCGFGQRPPDGAIALDDLDATAVSGPAAAMASARRASPGRGAHLATITWDVTVDGPVPVARSDAHLIAGGLAVMLESALPLNAGILSTIPPGSFGGIDDLGALAPGRRNARAPSPVRRRDLCAAMPGPSGRRRGRSGTAGRAACGGRRPVGPAWPQGRGRGLAGARASAPRARLARVRDLRDRRAVVRRDRPDRGAAGRGR
jgi:hypothetical protein